MPTELTAHDLSSSDKFVRFICDGLAHGMLPDQQGGTLLSSGRLVELVPGSRVPVKLFRHC